ncbi:MAG TPA: vWA domain-containing protein [Kofleriaceae bacterium]|nr:vWA domain-containing protein [Kofleriaceae bacterium]
MTVRVSVLAASLMLVAAAGCAPRGRRGGPTGPVVVVPFAARVQVRVDAWARLSTATEGRTVESRAAADVPVLIRTIFDEGIPPGPVDVVFVVDTTGSMIDDVDAVKRDMRTILAHLRERNPDYQVGIVAYRDVNDDYLTRTFAMLTRDDAIVEAALAAIEVTGGDDWREHVYAGIHTALRLQPWRPHASQHIMLMGDAPPHDDYVNDPRTFASVTAEARSSGLHVRIHTVGIKCDRSCEDALAAEERERAQQGRVIP